MPKWGVLLHVEDIAIEGKDDRLQLGGAYVKCCVWAPDEEEAGAKAVTVLSGNPKYQALERWPPGTPGRPRLTVDSADRLSLIHPPYMPGELSGFIYYVDTDLPENRDTEDESEDESE